MGLFKPRNVIQRSVGELLNEQMAEIKRLFPDGTKVTCVIRSPGLEGPLVITNDQPHEVIAAVRSLTERRDSVIVQE